MKDKKKIDPKVFVLGGTVVLSTVLAVVAFRKSMAFQKTLNGITEKLSIPYKPFTDMSKDAAIELLKKAVEGGVEILDAQGPMETDEIIIFLKNH